MSEPKSRAQAINAKCRECIYDPHAAGTWREQVAACPSANCALHSFRPKPRYVRTAEDLRRLRDVLNIRNRAAA